MFTGRRLISLSLYCDFGEITPALRSEMQMCGCDGNVDGVKLFSVRKVILTKTEGGTDRKRSLMKQSQSLEISLDTKAVYNVFCK